MKLWKRWTAAALAAAMALLLLAACGPSGPSAPDAPDKPGSSETGKDPTDKKTEAQKVAAVVEALNTVRKNIIASLSYSLSGSFSKRIFVPFFRNSFPK